MTISLLPLSLLLATAGAPKVARVILYPDRAQVTRATSVSCGARTVVEFGGIPPAADTGSFRAHAKGGTVDGVRWEERTREEAFAAGAKEIDAELRRLQAESALLQGVRAREENTARLAAMYANVALTMMGREMSEPAPGVAAWTAALETTLSARLKAAGESAGTNPRARELARRVEELQRKRARLAASTQRREYVAEVLVSCPSGGRADVELGYMVGGASWSPAYEARADEGSGKVEIGTYATVRQATGEDWRDTQVVLSTAVPRQNATPPEIAQLKVWADERPPPRKVIVSRQEQVRHADAPSGGPSGDTASRMQFASQGLSVQITVPEAADVPGDGTPKRLFVGRTPMKAEFRYRTSPKLMPFVFRVAELTNTAPFPLLPGPVDAFRRGGFIARHHLPRVAVGEKLKLSFGVEESMTVKRTVVEELQRDKGLFGGTRHHRFAYKLEVSNYLPRGEEIELSEHVPVSELDDVKVVVDGRTTGGYQLEPVDGIMAWRLKLKPGERRIVDLVFRVEIPTSYEQ